MKNEIVALISKIRTDLLIRFALTSTISLIVIALIVYIAVRILVIDDLQNRLLTLESDFNALSERSAMNTTANNQRLDILEQEVFGALQNKPAIIIPRTAAEVWQVNRDRELRDRITRLERWRLSQGN